MNHLLVVLARIGFIVIVFFNLLVACQISKGANQIKDLSLGGFVYTTAFSPDGNIFAAGGFNKVVKLWDTKSWQLKYELKHPEIVTDITFAPSQKVLATVNNELGNNGSSNVRVLFWNIETGEKISTYKEDSCPYAITSIAFSPDGKIMAVGFGDGLVKLLDVEMPEAVKVVNEKFTVFDSGISSLRFSPDSQFLAVGVGKGISGPKDFGTFKVLDIKTGREIFKESSLSIVYNLAFSPDGKILAAAGSKKERREETHQTLLLYNTASWKKLEEIKNHPVGKGLEFSHNGQLLISSSPGELKSKIVVWNLKTKQLMMSLNNSSSITSLTLSPMATLIAVGDETGHIYVYSISKNSKS